MTLNLNSSVTLLGVRHDIPALLHLADVFVFPSYYEGHPGSLVEAMLAGCPIVVSGIAVHQEMLVHGETGLLTPVGDPAAIADSVINLLQDTSRAKRMGQAAQHVATQRFDIDRVARQHEEVYRRVLASAARRS